MTSHRFRNKVLEVRRYAHLCGSDRERTLVAAPLMVDGFFDIHSPRGERDFDPRNYRDLYRYILRDASPDEVSPWYDMVKTFLDMARIGGSDELQQLYGKLRYHDIVAVSRRNVVGFASLATMPLDQEQAVVYALYLGGADAEFMRKRYGRDEDFTRKGLARLLFVLGHGVAEEDAQKLGYASTVAGTMFEAEFIGQATTAKAIRNTKLRLDIYRRLGALTLMADTGSGLITPHVQPALTANLKPILLHLLFRPREIDSVKLGEVSEVSRELVENLLRAYAYNFEWQSAPEEMTSMREVTAARLSAAKRFVLVPPEHLPNIVDMAQTDLMLRKQVEAEFGSLSALERKIKKALG